MRIVFVGVFNNIGSTNVSQAESFERLGVKVVRFEYRQLVKDTSISKMIDMLVETCRVQRPDFLLIAKGTPTISSEVIEICNQYTKSVLWWPDSYPRSDWDTDKVRDSNIVICAKKQAVEAAKVLNPNSYLVYEGYDKQVDYPVPFVQDTDVSFIGNIYGNRGEICKRNNISIFSNIFGTYHSEIVGRSKINLNLCTDRCASDRVFKVLAAKGFLLTDDWEGREELFLNGKDLVIFKDEEDMKEKIVYYINHREERDRIADNGYQEVQKYTRDNWARRILEIVRKRCE